MTIVAIVATLFAATAASACTPRNPPAAPLLPNASGSVVACQNGQCQTPCAECILAHVDDFVCVGGGCEVLINRDCVQCAETSVAYRIEDITAKRGVDYSGAQSGEVHFPSGAKSASLVITTIPNAASRSGRTFRVILVVNGVEVDRAVGTIGTT